MGEAPVSTVCGVLSSTLETGTSATLSGSAEETRVAALEGLEAIGLCNSVEIFSGESERRARAPSREISFDIGECV